jgi:hypothetical protein
VTDNKLIAAQLASALLQKITPTGLPAKEAVRTYLEVLTLLNERDAEIAKGERA